MPCMWSQASTRAGELLKVTRAQVCADLAARDMKGVSRQDHCPFLGTQLPDTARAVGNFELVRRLLESPFHQVSGDVNSALAVDRGSRVLDQAHGLGGAIKGASRFTLPRRGPRASNRPNLR